jgi:hypothetical protein
MRRLVKETKDAFSGTARVITMAYYPDGAQEHAIVAHDLHRDVDLLHMMAYDKVSDKVAHDLQRDAALMDIMAYGKVCPKWSVWHVTRPIKNSLDVI